MGSNWYPQWVYDKREDITRENIKEYDRRRDVAYNEVKAKEKEFGRYLKMAEKREISEKYGL